MYPIANAVVAGGYDDEERERRQRYTLEFKQEEVRLVESVLNKLETIRSTLEEPICPDMSASVMWFWGGAWDRRSPAQSEFFRTDRLNAAQPMPNECYRQSRIESMANATTQEENRLRSNPARRAIEHRT